MGAYDRLLPDHLIDEALEDKPRKRDAKTETLLADLTRALLDQLRRRENLVDGYGKAAKQLEQNGVSRRDRRGTLAGVEGDHEGDEDRDLVTGAWLRRVSNLSAALEPTIAAVLAAVVHCSDSTKALADFAKAAKADPKIHAAKGAELLKAYPQYGNAAPEDRDQYDWSDLGRKREAQDKAAGK